jgi:serine/threonine-protein kinase
MSSAHANPPKSGDVIAGKYRIGPTLGSGGMGIVFEAMHLKLEQRVAIKVLKAGASVHASSARPALQLDSEALTSLA